MQWRAYIMIYLAFQKAFIFHFKENTAFEKICIFWAEKMVPSQTWRLESDHWKLCGGGRRELTLQSCPLTSTWPVYSHDIYKVWTQWWIHFKTPLPPPPKPLSFFGCLVKQTSTDAKKWHWIILSPDLPDRGTIALKEETQPPSEGPIWNLKLDLLHGGFVLIYAQISMRRWQTVFVVLKSKHSIIYFPVASGCVYSTSFLSGYH